MLALICVYIFVFLFLGFVHSRVIFLSMMPQIPFLTLPHVKAPIGPRLR